MARLQWVAGTVLGLALTLGLALANRQFARIAPPLELGPLVLGGLIAYAACRRKRY